MAIQEWVPSTRSDGTRYKDNFLSAGGTCTQPELRQLQVSPPSATSLAPAHQSAHSFPNPQPASAHHMSTLVRNLGPPCAQRPPALARWPPTLLEQDRPLPRGPTSTCACHCHPLCRVIGHRCKSPPSPPPPPAQTICKRTRTTPTSSPFEAAAALTHSALPRLQRPATIDACSGVAPRYTSSHPD
jgi:hypothetical protein